MKLEYDLTKIKRTDFPIILDPQITSFTDVATHTFLRQRLSSNTIEKQLSIARYMETHRVPVNFRNPTFENFMAHMDYREQVENAGNGALSNEWKTMRMFLKAYGIEIWSYKAPSQPVYRARIILFPDVVYKFFHYQYSEDDYKNTLYQYLFCHSVLIGWRVPSEICELTTKDVVMNDNGTGCIVITEVKKHRSQRTLFPGKQLLVSKTHKSFKNWIDYWRPKVTNQYSKDAFYLQPNGRPLTVRPSDTNSAATANKSGKISSPMT